jgi:hypothetical protein
LGSTVCQLWGEIRKGQDGNHLVVIVQGQEGKEMEQHKQSVTEPDLAELILHIKWNSA